MNKFPDMQSVIKHQNPLFLVQILNIIAIDGSKFNILYIQDIHTFKILCHWIFETPLKYGVGVDYILEFLRDNKLSDNITFIFLKSSPFYNPIFINIIKALNLNYTYYKRSETLKIYQTQRLTLKGLIIINPNNIDNLIRTWNGSATRCLIDESRIKEVL